MDGEYFEDGFKINLGISNNLLGKGQTPLMHAGNKASEMTLNNSRKNEISVDNDPHPTILNSSKNPIYPIISSQQRLINEQKDIQ